jgi:hypothetical protein
MVKNETQVDGNELLRALKQFPRRKTTLFVNYLQNMEVRHLCT